MRRRPLAVRPFCWWQPEIRLIVDLTSLVSGGVEDVVEVVMSVKITPAVEVVLSVKTTPAVEVNAWIDR